MGAYCITSPPRTWAGWAVSGAGKRHQSGGLGSGARLRWLASSPLGALPPPSPRSEQRGRGSAGNARSARPFGAPHSHPPIDGGSLRKIHPSFCAVSPSILGGRSCAKRGFCARRPLFSGGGARRGAPHCCTALGTPGHFTHYAGRRSEPMGRRPLRGLRARAAQPMPPGGSPGNR